jgi:hypothetical protein
LIEGNKLIWSSNTVNTNHRGFDVREESDTGLMIVNIGSGQYEFQAVWK